MDGREQLPPHSSPRPECLPLGLDRLWWKTMILRNYAGGSIFDRMGCRQHLASVTIPLGPVTPG